MDPYLTFIAKVGELHAALPPEQTPGSPAATHWRGIEGSVGDVIAEAMNLAQLHGHSIEACYAALDGPDHVPASVPA